MIPNAAGVAKWYRNLSVQADFRYEEPLMDMELDDMEAKVVLKGYSLTEDFSGNKEISAVDM